MWLFLTLVQCLLVTTIETTRVEFFNDTKTIGKRALQKSHEKSRILKLSEYFLEKDFYSDDPDLSLINLLNEVATQYLSDCTTAILYDGYAEEEDHVFLKKFFQQYRLTYVHGRIPNDYHTQMGELVNDNDKKCVHFIIFIKDVMKCRDVVTKRREKVVVVAKSTQWRVQEYLGSEYSQEIANLLIVVKSEKFLQQKLEPQYIVYTHKLFVDALGSSQPVVLTSWTGTNFSRNVTLFQEKLTHGFSGHRFIIATAHQPPYVIRKQRNDRDELEFEGIEIKLVNLLSEMYNFSTDYKQASDIGTLGSGEAVMKAVKVENINLGIGGLYITSSRYNAGNFHWHSEDCASFISLASTALPRYRAIMGPFRWTVWLALIGVYFAAIFLFAYSDKSTLRHLLKNPEELENMFWYVFGTFTNCFTFSNKQSWTKAEKNTTKLLVGMYWIFTIIITACYTGSIIAFVTLPVFPAVIDTLEQLLSGRYQTGILDKGGWPAWFQNVTDTTSAKLLKRIDYVPDVESGLRNVTRAFFWPYAFLGSREELSYIVKTNFTTGNKKSLMHISNECFANFKVGLILPSRSVYSDILGEGVQRILQSGFNIKMKNDVEWDMLRIATGKLLPVNSRAGGIQSLTREDRALTLDDTQGMFLLLGAGYLIAGAILFSEIFGGCFNLCKKRQDSRAVSSGSSIPSNPRFHERQTVRDRQRSICLEKHLSPGCSFKRSDTLFNKQHVEEPFGETLVREKLQKFGETPELDNVSNLSSIIDYNEEISKLFSEALENEDLDAIRSDNDNDKT